MKRVAPTAAIISALICVGAATLWLRSFVTIDAFFGQFWSHYSAGFFRICDIDSCKGSISVLVVDPIAPETLGDHPSGTWTWSTAEARGGRKWSRQDLWFGWSITRDKDVPQFGENSLNGGSFWVRIPEWSLVLATAVVPALWARGEIRLRRRKSRGLCQVCGYDLRGAPGRCPECGWAASGADDGPASEPSRV
jgi:hypothetical protein